MRIQPLLPGLLLCSACAAPPAPLAEPAVSPVVTYQALAQHPLAATDGFGLRIEVLALSMAPPGPAVDLGAAAIPSEREPPFRGSSPLPLGSRWLAGAAARAFADHRPLLTPAQLQTLGETSVVVFGGAATGVTIAGLGRLELSHAGDGTAIRLFAADDDQERVAVRLADVLTDGDTAAWFVPAPAAGGVGRACVLHASGPASPTALQQVVAELNASTAPVAQWPHPWLVARAAVGQHNRRPALLALAAPLHLTRVVDLLLAADEQALIDITRALDGLDPNATDLAWQLERGVWLALLPRHERNELPDGLHGVFLRRLGATAADPATLRQYLIQAADAAGFLASLYDDNRLALSDRAAAHRVRAHDWLLAQHRAVPGYAPLGGAAERRAALRAHPVESR